MEYLAGFLIAVGSFYLIGFVLQFPFFYNNAKSKALIKMMGKTGFNIFLVVFGVIFLAVGILLIP